MKKPSYSTLHVASEGEGGAGENRTLVQTGKLTAFYMCSCKLIFVTEPEGNLQFSTYSLKFSFVPRDAVQLIPNFQHFRITRLWLGLVGNGSSQHLVSQ